VISFSYLDRSVNDVEERRSLLWLSMIRIRAMSKIFNVHANIYFFKKRQNFKKHLPDGILRKTYYFYNCENETDFFLSQVWLVSLRHVIIVLNVPAKHIVMEKVIMDIQRTNDILLVGWLVVSRKETFRNAHGSRRGKQGQDNSAFKSYQSQLTTCLLNLNLYSGDIFWEQTD